MTRRKNNTLHLHSKLALEIKAAKKAMFRRHREGMDAREAANKFTLDMLGRFETVLGKREPIPDFPNLKRAMAAADRDRQAAADPLCDCPQPDAPLLPACLVCGCPHCNIMPKMRERECPRCNYYHCAGKAGDSAIVAGYTLLSDDELGLACARLGESVSGEYFIGLVILLLNHLVAVEVAGRDLEGVIIDIQEAVLRANTAATGFAVDALAAKTGKHLSLKAKGIDKDWKTGAESPEESVTDALPKSEPSNVNEDVLRAMSELLHNPETPHDLFDAVAEFVCDQSNSRVGIGSILHREPVLAEILKTVAPEDRRGAVIAKAESEHA